VTGSGIELSERGDHELKGVPGVWSTYAVAAPEPVAEPAVAAPMPAPRRPTNLPQPTDPFLGRDDDLTRVSAAVAYSPLVTLAGPGGVGKTRLAVEYAHAASLESWFVDLSRVQDEDGVAATFLATLGVSPRADSTDADRVVEALEARSVLLLVDNCEHV